jgi:hypothetical protein
MKLLTAFTLIMLLVIITWTFLVITMNLVTERTFILCMTPAVIGVFLIWNWINAYREYKLKIKRGF